MYAKTVIVTPEQATIWLDTKNSRNRPVSQSTVDRYVQEMKAGNWKENGQGIIFGKDGQLINGQHRLKACVAANKTFTTLVVYGIDNESFDTIDDGSQRSLAEEDDAFGYVISYGDQQQTLLSSHPIHRIASDAITAGGVMLDFLKKKAVEEFVK